MPFLYNDFLTRTPCLLGREVTHADSLTIRRFNISLAEFPLTVFCGNCTRLNNLTLKRAENQQLALEVAPQFKENYLLSYMLDVESQGSLLNIQSFVHPFDYQLNIASGADHPRLTSDQGEKAYEALARHLRLSYGCGHGNPVADWNDAEDRTAEQVIAALRSAAQAEREAS